MTREQRLVFGEVAETYDRARPGYPEAVVDDLVARARLFDGVARAIDDAGGTMPVAYTVELYIASKAG